MGGGEEERGEKGRIKRAGQLTQLKEEQEKKREGGRVSEGKSEREE